MVYMVMREILAFSESLYGHKKRQVEAHREPEAEKGARSAQMHRQPRHPVLLCTHKAMPPSERSMPNIVSAKTGQSRTLALGRSTCKVGTDWTRVGDLKGDTNRD